MSGAPLGKILDPIGHFLHGGKKSGGGGGGGTAAPPPPTPANSADDLAAAAEDERRRTRGRASNILTSGQGLLGAPTTATRTLLGGL